MLLAVLIEPALSYEQVKNNTTYTLSIGEQAEAEQARSLLAIKGSQALWVPLGMTPSCTMTFLPIGEPTFF